MSEFHKKHIGPSEKEIDEMLQVLGCSSLNDLLEKIVPKNILDIDDSAIGNREFSEMISSSMLKTKGREILFFVH